MDENLKTATFAGGCFWCMQHPFDDLEGVVKTTVGYTGGQIPLPTYQQVCAGNTGHTEAIEIVYDPQKISYSALLEVFWHLIDPTTRNQQFFDKGSQYHTVIFYHDEQQKLEAEESKKKLLQRFSTIATDIRSAVEFYPAEEYHQCFYKKSAQHYHQYSVQSGRQARLEELWEDKT